MLDALADVGHVIRRDKSDGRVLILLDPSSCRLNKLEEKAKPKWKLYIEQVG